MGHNFSSKEQVSFSFMAAVTICNDFGATPKWNLSLFPLFPHLFAKKLCDQMPWSSGFLVLFCFLSFMPAFTLFFHFHQEALQFLFAFCHKGGVICISEVTDTSPCNLGYSLCFIQPNISHDVLCIWVKLAGWQYTALMHSFPNLEPFHCSMSGSNCCFLTCIQISQEAGFPSL